MSADEKKVINVEFKQDFYDWLSTYSTQVGLPMDKVLVLLALAGVDHFAKCENIRIDPIAHRARLLKEEAHGGI